MTPFEPGKIPSGNTGRSRALENTWRYNEVLSCGASDTKNITAAFDWPRTLYLTFYFRIKFIFIIIIIIIILEMSYALIYKRNIIIIERGLVDSKLKLYQ